tara:strand:- start:172 stop:441 length:270 start_codon:yes stop_codon:yes gene_type:complete
MNVLIIGGAGYIGSSVSHYLLDKGHQKTIIDNLSIGPIRNIPKKASFHKIDISNEKKFNLISKNKVNYKIGKRRNSDILISISNPKKTN